MYVLILELPFGITLLYRQIFTSTDAATSFSKRHPYNFTPIRLSEIKPEYVLVPLNPIKIEEK